MVRKPITRSQPMPRRKAPTRKGPAMLHCESALEDEAALRFEACPTVAGIGVQTRRIPYRLDGITRHATPDFELGLADGQVVLVEIKHSRQAARPEIAEKLAAVRLGSEALGYAYHVVTERWVRFLPVLENLRVLARWRAGRTVPGFDPRLIDTTAALPLPWAEVAHRLGGRATAAAHVLAGRLHMNLLEGLTESSTVLPTPHRPTAIALELPWGTPEGRRIWGEPL